MSEKKGRFGLEDDKLSFRHAASEVFFQRVIDKWPISPVAQERGGCLSSASKTLIGSS